MPDVKWIKITTDMFDNRKIKHIRKLPEGNNIVLIWVMLLTMAGKCNAGGMIFLTENIPYTTKMLADELDFEENVVIVALKALEEFGMIYTNENVLAISGWDEHQNIEGMEKIREQNRQRQARFKAKQKLLLGNVTDNVISRDGNATEEEKEKIKDKEKEKIQYNVVVDDYNRICANLPKVTALSDARKKAIKARINKYGCDGVMKAFRKASESDFLNGTNGRNWRANFDWIMKDANMAKILDGNYDNGGQAEGGDYFSRNGIDDPLKDLDIDFSEG